jgi:hypothetical protein
MCRNDVLKMEKDGKRNRYYPVEADGEPHEK